MRFSTRSKYQLAMAAAGALAAIPSARAWGQNVVNYSSGSVSQNFSTLSSTPDPGTSGANGTVDIDTSGFGNGGAAMAGWYYYAQTKNVYIVDTNGQTGSTSTGGLYAYGSTGSVAAMGMETASGSGDETVAVELVNTSGSTLNSFTVSFNDATYHYGDTAGNSKTLLFDYDVTTSGATASIPTTGLSTTGLNYTATNPTTISNSAGTYENGVNPVTETGTIFGTGGLNWQNGNALWLEWVINSSAAQSPGIGISNFSFSASSSSGPTVTWNTGTGTWDDVSHNWTGTSTTYADGDGVTFANSISSNSIVTVQPTGVAPASVTINNTTGFKYTFTGGAIGGTTGLFNEAGVTELASANTYSGGTFISGGTVIADGDATLGASTGGIVFAGGALTAGAAIGTTVTPSARGITVNAGGGTFNTNGFNSDLTGANSIGDVFNVNGSGGLELDGGTIFSATGALNIGTGATVTIGTTGTVTQINSGTYNGKFVVANTARINFDDSSTISGSGEIDLNNPGTTEVVTVTGSPNVVYTTYDLGIAMTNSNTSTGVANVDVPVKLNANNLSFTAADVSQPNASFVPGSFTVSIGGTKGGGLNIEQPISGNSDVNIANAPGGGGAGETIFDAANTYTGTTLINTSGTFQLAVAGAIPSTSNVIFGTIQGAEGKNTTVDLDGTVQTFASLSSGQWGKASDELITNDNLSALPATLVVSGSVTPANPFIGTLSDGVGTLALEKAGTNTLDLTGTNNLYSGGTTINGGTLEINGDAALGSTAGPGPGSLTFGGGTLGIVAGTTTASARPVTVNPGGGTIDVANGSSYTLTGSPTLDWNGGNLTFTDTGSAALAQNTGTVTVVPGSTLTVNAGASLAVTGPVDPFTDSVVSTNHVAVVNNGNLSVSQVHSTIASITGSGSLTVGNGSSHDLLQIAPGPLNGGVSAANSVGSLSITNNATLDITNNILVINYGAPANDPIQSIANLIHEGAYGFGNTVTWTGNGITSSTAAANAGSYGIGYADSADPGNPANLSSGQVEIMYTLLGDANLDGKVNGSDFTILANNFNQTVTAGWDKGDFNYDGSVNGSDFTLLANNFNQSATQGVIAGADDLQVLEDFAAANGISLTPVSVPEPTSIGLLAAGAVGLMARRRRRAN